MKPLSHTSISLYLQCPLKYKIRYIDGLKEKPRSYLSFGKSMHQALEYFFGSKFPIPPSLQDVIDYYEKNWLKEGYVDAEEETKYSEHGKMVLKDFYDKHVKEYKKPLAVEHKIYFDIAGVSVVAVMDRIDKINDKTVAVIDYKTNKNPFTLSDLKEEPQLTMYQLAIEQEMGMKVEELTYYHLLSNTPFTIPRHTDEQVKLLKDRIVNVAQNIQKEEFPYRENKYCPCDFGNFCPLYMHQYKKDESREDKSIDIVKVADEYGELKDRNKESSLRIEALQQEIKDYMSKEKVARVFGDKYEVTKSVTSQERLDTRKAKEILEEHNLLDGLTKTVESETIRYRERKPDRD